MYVLMTREGGGDICTRGLTSIGARARSTGLLKKGLQPSIQTTDSGPRLPENVSNSAWRFSVVRSANVSTRFRLTVSHNIRAATGTTVRAIRIYFHDAAVRLLGFWRMPSMGDCAPRACTRQSKTIKVNRYPPPFSCYLWNRRVSSLTSLIISGFSESRNITKCVNIVIA